jgi:hypothetical protein
VKGGLLQKRIAIAFGLVLVLAAAGYLVYRYVFELDDTKPAPVEPAAPSPPVESPAAESGLIKVSSVEGKVERSHAGSSWTPVHSGDNLKLDESIRTDENGRAILDIGKQATVEMGSSSESSVKEISQEVSRLRLEQGRISTVVHGKGKSVFRVETRGSDAVAETDKGEFSVLSSGKGQVSVASHTGAVRLSARNKSIEVPAGTHSVVRKDLPPAPPKPIPASLFLKVGKPRSLIQRERNTTVSGTASPGAVVSINGVQAQVDQAGKFNATIPLREGNNRVVVVATDVTGRKKKTALPKITVDSQAPKVQSKVRWGAKKKKKKKKKNR